MLELLGKTYLRTKFTPVLTNFVKEQLETDIMSFIMPKLSLKELMERSVHFGHKTSRWNPKMAPYIYKKHSGVHIIDLPQTITMMQKAFSALYETVKNGGRVLFVGTKFQARKYVKEAAERSGQYHMSHRWLGGTLTNWSTISTSLKTLRELTEKIASPQFPDYTKKEQLGFTRDLEKYELSLGGIKNMGGLPDMLFVIDINKENIAVREARQLNIPIIAICDTNTDPTSIDFPIPGNDDGLRAIEFYCDSAAQAILAGLHDEMKDRQGHILAEEGTHTDTAIKGE